MECCKKDLKLMAGDEIVAEAKHTDEGLLIKCSDKCKEYFKKHCGCC